MHARMRGRGTARRDAMRNKERTYLGAIASLFFGIEVGGRWGDEAATFLRFLAPHQTPSSPSPSAPLPHQRLDPPLECSRMRPRMVSQHSFLTKASLAATTVTAPLPPSVRCSLKLPVPSAKADPQPCPSWTFGLSYAHPLAAGVSRASSRHDVVCPFSCIVGTYNVFAFHVRVP